MLNTCRAVCWILAFAAALFVATVCVYWAGLHGLLSAVIGLIALLGAGYLFPELFCSGRDVFPEDPEPPVAAATTVAPVVPEVASQPEELPEVLKPKLYGDAPDNIDDLKAISGVGPALEKKLNGLGVYRYEQIASWTPANVKWVDEKLSFRGRIERDDWVKQAGELARG
jgi:predicted flap endonuclease-1-like 5' DNA nuclease